MPKYLTEFIGTFFLVFTICCAVVGGAHVPELAIGAVLMVMVFAGGHVSGAHYNPAVTVAVTMRGRCSLNDAIPYVIVQVIGAVGAALAASFVLPGDKVAQIQALDLSSVRAKAFVCEALFTFALCYVVLNVATAKGTANNPFYGLAIGFTVLAGAFAVGPISGGAFNPAVAVGISVMGLTLWSNFWIYLAADLIGAACAAIVFKTINPTDR